ncbi:hypothetical protein BN10_690003 [Phycicoccus elongatus Lp2]|uniref:Uncharacterized protein n=1 Tax=Phycicoccus elongatus Lp2 TaxID=1193181 RepID=N0E605_9MICO|nr:hypothetical protein BN10_690003 [Phycicoccus elongatus Lp2]
MRVIARLTLDRVVENVFAETEQAASLRVAHRPLIPRRGPASRPSLSWTESPRGASTQPR